MNAFTNALDKIFLENTHLLPVKEEGGSGVKICIDFCSK